MMGSVACYLVTLVIFLAHVKESRQKNPICDWCKPEKKMPVTDKTDISFYLIFSRSPLYVTAQPIHPTSCVDPDPVKKNFGFESTIVK